MRSGRWRYVALAAALSALVAAGASGPAPTPTPRQRIAAPKPKPTTTTTASAVPGGTEWADVDRLVSQQKFAEALKIVSARRAAAQKAGDEAEWTRGLVREIQLTIGLHGYETAVRNLREQPWPKALEHRAVLELYYAQALKYYLAVYSWEIRQRERVESSGVVDLKSWTSEQIGEEASRAYLRLWSEREALGRMRVDRLAEFLQPNTYPSGVRETVRDALSYFFVAHLADTSSWSPADSNEVFRLDLAGLLDASASRPAGKPEDPALHPLVRLCAVLTDLERWHASRDEREGELEARLERARRLFTSFTEDADRAKIVADLAGRLPAFKGVPWFAMGKGELAKLVQGGADGDFVRARAIAKEGLAAYPDSVGGRECRQIVESIEAPSYALEAMSNDAADRRSIRVRHKNVARLHFRSYALDFEARLAKAQNENQVLPDTNEARQIVDREKPEAEWTVDLPATPDYREHFTFVVPRAKGTGLHMVAASDGGSFGGGTPVYATSYFVSDLVLVSRSAAGAPLEVQALSGATGKPISDAEVSLFKASWNPQSIERVSTARTDAAGFARIPQPDEGQYFQRFLVGRRGSDFAYERNVWFNGKVPPDPPASSLVFTDRSVYRPLQKVLWKVVAYRGDRLKGRLSVFPQTPVTLTLIDPNNQTVATQSVTTNEFGSAAGEFVVPSGRVLGAWRVGSSLGGGAAGIRVEEYKRPSFEVTLKDAKELLRLNHPASITGEARYYFGLPVAHGEVRWRVNRSPQYWWWSFWSWGYSPEVRTQTVAAGRSPIGDDGSFTIAFTPVADEREGSPARRPGSWRYEVSVDAVDEGGETHSASRTFRLGFVSVEARVDAQPGFLPEKSASRLTIVRTDLDGAPRAGKGSWTLSRLEQPATPLLPADEPRALAPSARPGGKPGTAVQTPGDSQRARWETDFDPRRTLAGWKDGPEVARGETAHDANAKGKGTAELPALPAGVYRLRYKTADDTGGLFELPVEIVVAGPRTPAALPVILRERDSTVPVGGTAAFLATSGFSGQPLLFEKYRQGRLVERRELVGGRSAALVEMHVGESDRGGFAVRLTMLRDHQLVTLNSSVFVPWDDKELVVSYETFRDKLRPGAAETWRVKVAPRAKDGKAEAGAAELLAYMYDRSLDTFAPHSPASVTGLYPQGAFPDGIRAHLGQAYFMYLSGSFPSIFLFTPPHGDGLKIPSGYPIGGPGRRGGVMAYAGQAVVVSAESRVMEADELKAAAPARERNEVGDVALPASAPMAKAKALAGVAGGAVAPGAPVELRSNFAETAFWKPALRTDATGAASIEFTVPDSVTAWKVWVHALTKDMKGGSASNDTRSVKDLMVRPYVPRFLREGDRADLEVVVDNASEKAMSGTVELDVLDAETNASVLAEFGLTKEKARAPFTAAAGQGAHVPFAILAPPRARLYAIRATAVSGTFSDGELRPVPVLPGRMSLAQSRFAALAGQDSRTLTFPDLAKNDDPTRIDEQLVVTVDAQLFDSVLQALPYLVRYPYECTEQTLNRFVSTSIVEAVFRDNPSVAKMAAAMAKRGTRLAPWDESDPNRRMALEETPWLQQARGGADTGLELARILNPEVAKAERDAAIEKLRKAQTPEGGFPWWPGGPPSPYMTVYILHGFANALELGADVPRDMVEKAWGYAGRQLRHDLDECMSWIHFCPMVTFVNYTLSSYPDPSWYKNAFDEKYRQVLLGYSFARWKQHSPYLKAQLALTLVRTKRPDDAKLVWSSVMDSAKTDRDLGTYWAPEDRAWLWYNDTIETQAMALRALMEVDATDARRHGLVQWLFLNKKLNQWKSTRATAEVIASLIRYLKSENLLGIREEAAVDVGGRRSTFVFEPDKYTGAKNQVVVPGEKIDPARDSKIVVEKISKGMSFASATWSFSTERLPAEERGDFFTVSRRYFRREASTSGFVLKPLGEVETLVPGDEIEVQISLTAKHEAEYVHLRDPRPAGAEPVKQTSGYRWDLGLARYEEVRDSGQNFFFEKLPVGQYTMKYRLRASMGGTFKVAPATVQSMYAPEFHAYSAGNVLRIGPAKR